MSIEMKRLIFFLAVFSCFDIVLAVQQHTFIFDLNNPTFNFSNYQLNDSSTSKEIVFNSNEEKTVWINIPKNSTILDSLIKIEGISKPIITSTQQQVLDLFVGNIIEDNEWDEILVGVTGSEQNLKLLNSSGFQIWNYSIAASVPAVSAGNLSSDRGMEIVAAASTRIIYVLNSTGNLLSTKNMNYDIKEIEISDINTSNPFDEIIVASDKLYLLDNNLNEIWSFSTSLPFEGVSAGDLGDDQGKEIVAVTSSNIYIINSTGDLKSSRSIGNLKDVHVSNIDGYGYDEIAVALTNGTIYLLDNNLNILFSTSFSTYAINKIKISEVTSEYEGREIVFGSDDDNVYVVNATGSLVWKYKTENDVKGIGIGNLTNDIGNEVVAGTIIPATNTLYILNFEYFPTNLYVDIGNDGVREWFYPGKFRTQDIVTNNTAFQIYLNTCEGDENGLCSVPIVFHSDYAGILKVSSLNITYSYNISDIFTVTISPYWSRIAEIRGNESVGNQIKNISYLKPPAHEVAFNYITIDQDAFVCDFNGKRYQVVIIDGRKVCNISFRQISANATFDYLWDDTMSKSIPIFYNESDGVSEYGFWKRNVTVWNVTTQIFFNVSLNASLDDNYITGNSKLEVDWFGNNVFYDITPPNSQTNCNTSNPTYTKIMIGDDEFYVCKQDTNGDGKIDFFSWKQPHTNRSFVLYELSGSANNPPVAFNFSITPAEDFWGKNFTVKFNISDAEGNNVSVRICLNLTHTFDLNKVNVSSAEWYCINETNSTGNTNIGEEVSFVLESNISWTGFNLLSIQLKDFDENVEYHDWFVHSIYYAPNVSKHTTQAIAIEGMGASVNRTESVRLVALINDTVINESIGNVKCRFFVSFNDTHWMHYDAVSNSSGHCKYELIPNSSYIPGLRWWKVGVYNDSYYNDSISENFTIGIYGKINVNLTESMKSNITRNQQKILEAKIYDEFGKTINQSGYVCSFYLNQTVIGANQTQSNGICLVRFIPDCSYELGAYNLNVSLSGNANDYYLYNKSSDQNQIYLKDRLNANILSPQPNEIYHKGNEMNLSFSISDSCGAPTENYDTIWILNCTTNGYLPYQTTLNEGNTSWRVECNPGKLLLSLKAYGNVYEFGSSNRSIDIYGWSSVKMIHPINGTYNRTETLRKIDIVCEVSDANTTNIKLDGYKVSIVKVYEGNQSILAELNTIYPTGRVNYTWNISSPEEVPEGWYKILCNISDQELDEYRKFNVSVAQDFADILIIEVDTMPPKINNITINSTLKGGDVKLNVDVSDWYGVDAVWGLVKYPDGSEQEIVLSNKTPDKRQTIWEINFTNLNEVGDYDVFLFANDTSNFTTNVTAWFEVYLPIQLYAETNYPKRFTFYRPGTQIVVHNFTYPSGFHNMTLHKRNYDLKAEIDDDIGQRHFLIFNNLNATLTAERQLADNITNPLNISAIPLSLLNPPVPWRHEVGGLYISTNFAYSNITIYFDYSKKLMEIDYAPALVIYKCSDWNGTCKSGWIQVNSSLDAEKHKIFTIQDNASAYYAFEAEICGNSICGMGESCVNCVQDCGECGSGLAGPQTSGSGGGGIGGSYTSKCGNGVCDADENPFSCPQDCMLGFSVKTNLTTDYVRPGTKRGYVLWLSNLASQPLQAEISINGIVSKILTVKERNVLVSSNKEKEISIELIVPENMESGTYTGEIVVSASGRKERLPVTVFVSKDIQEVQLTVKVITKNLKPNETLAFEVSIFSLGQKKEFLSQMNYTIKPIKGGDVIYEAYEINYVKTPYQAIKYVRLPANISSGKYYVMVNASYDDEILSSIDSFEVALSIINAKTIRYALIVFASLLGIVALVLTVRRYQKWKKSKFKYIFPVDFNLLPKGDLTIGKIAETDVKATFDSVDLMTHVIIAGSTGAGKSVTASVFAEELLDKKLPVVVFDPTAQWTGFVKPCKDENVLKYYKKHGMSLDDTKSYPGNIYEMTNPKAKIDLKKYMNPGEITVFVLNKLKPGEYDEAVTNIINSIFSESWEETTKPRLIIVFDEVHRLLEKYGGKGGYIALERACREFRKWGIGLIMVSQVLSDFKEAIKGNVLTEIQMHTKSLGDLQRIEKKYGLEYARRVAKEEVGIGMIQNPKYNKGLPWFVAFKPPKHMPHKISEQEMQMYKEYNSRIEKIEQEIERLEREGKDVFDLKIELKLAKEKLKKGMFRVAEIYIESLEKKLGLSK